MNTRTELEPESIASLSVRGDQPLIGVIVQQDGEEVVRYFADEEAADQALSEDSIQTALSLAGAWKDLDWEDALDQIDRIRYESMPTPPIEGL